jgi:hypothetical protein
VSNETPIRTVPPGLPMVLALAGALLLAACAAAPRSATPATPDTPAASAVDAPLPADAGRIVFYRPPSGLSQFMWSHLQPDIRLNGVAVGRSEPGRVFFVDRPAGHYEVSVTTDEERTIDFALGAGQVRYVRTVLGHGEVRPLILPELVEAEDGARESAGLTPAP